MSKGDGVRPLGVPPEVFRANWDRIFAGKPSCTLCGRALSRLEVGLCQQCLHPEEEAP